MVFLFFFMEKIKKLPKKIGKSALMNSIVSTLINYISLMRLIFCFFIYL